MRFTFEMALWASMAAAAAGGVAAATPAPGPTVIGTLKATIDGTPKTWFVHDAGDVSGASWTDDGRGRYNAVLTGFGSRDTRASGSQLTVSFNFEHGSTTARHRVEGERHADAAVRLIPSVDDLTEVHTLSQGQVVVTSIAASEPAGYRFSGTFAGTLRDAEGRPAGAIRDGAFEVTQATPVDPVRGAPAGSGGRGRDQPE